MPFAVVQTAHRVVQEAPKHGQAIRSRGGYYLDKHPNSKIASLVKDAYEFFCFDVFCERSNKRFQEEFGGDNLFGEKVDCKQFLEDYFKIKFKD